MEKLSSGLDDGSATCNQKETNRHDSRLLLIQQCVKYFVHSYKCKDENCRLPGCQKTKRVLQHASSCKEKVIGRCTICKQFVAFCCYHSKHCQEAECSFPFCAIVKNKLKQAKGTKQHVVTVRNSGPSFGVLQTVEVQAAAAARQIATDMIAASVSYGKDNSLIDSPTADTELMANTVDANMRSETNIAEDAHPAEKEQSDKCVENL